MISIRIDGLKQAIAGVGSAAKQVRFAAMRTLNRVSQEAVIPALQHEMADSFDRPTPFTLRSVRQIAFAKRDRLETTVGFKSDSGGSRPAADYLRWQVLGGQRRLKGFEVALRAVGVLPDDHYIVPGAGARFDAYGNVSRGQIVEVLSYFRAFDEEGKGFKLNATDATRRKKAKGTRSRFGYRYFAGRPGSRGAWGIWQDVRIAPGVRELLPVFLFVRWTLYKPRLDLRSAAAGAVRRNASNIFSDEYRKALATAR